MNRFRPNATLWAMFLALSATLICVSTVAGNSASHVRWDIVSLDFGPPVAANPGGFAHALAVDGSMIKMSGLGTFVAPSGGQGSNSSVTGGGTWETFNPAGVSTGGGTYWVTGLVRWDQAPGTLGTPPLDNIGNAAERSAGLAILRTEYSDGSKGILAVHCRLVGTPATMPEGISATKGFVNYFEVQAPVPGVDANRTLFHVRQ